MDVLTVGIVTIPFQFEGKIRNDQARIGVEKLRDNCDSLIVINNNKLREVYGNLGFKAGFSKADEVLATAARGIAEVITHHYTQNIDLKDAKTVLSNSGTAIMGSATASGVNRSEEAISKALDSPLLNDNKITGAKNVLLLIVSGIEEITIDEIGEINDYIQSEAKSNVNIIMGVGEDESLDDAISVTIVATGFNKDQQHSISSLEPEKIVHTLNDKENVFELSTKQVSNEKLTQPIEQEVKKDEKIVFDLGEEVEDDFNIIPSSEFINNIDVIYEEIAAIDVENFDDFKIKSISPAVENVAQIEENVVEEEEQQIEFTFDLPLNHSVKKEDIIETKVDVNEIEVKGHTVIEPPKKVEEDVYFSLEDYTELEENLVNAKKPTLDEEEVCDELNISLHKTTEIETNINEQEVVDHKEISPLDLTISELQKRAAERREKMKKFNYKFINKVNSNIEEIEKEPAYKRMGVELDETTHSSEISQSRTTLDTDDNDDIHLRSNNSFLHDNVD